MPLVDAPRNGPGSKPTWRNWNFGKHSFAENDAKQWAAWGVDYLKYDWFPNDAEKTKEMAEALRKTLRSEGPHIPRTTVRYAIERFPKEKRKELLEATRPD